MDQDSPTPHDQAAERQVRLALTLTGLVLLVLVLSLPMLNGQASRLPGVNQTTPSSANYMPLVLKDYPPSPTPSATETATATYTSTVTASPTISLTPTISRTPTKTVTGTPPTLTPTPTISLTPTSTATGTITPAPSLSVSANPTQASVNQIITFVIKLTNKGLAPADDAVVSDSFPTYVDVLSVSSNKGTSTKTAHALTVTIGKLFPNEEVKISVDVKINSGATRNETIANVVTLTYAPNKSLTASVNYSIKVSGLPGTGELPIEPEVTTIDWSLLFLAVALGIAGVFIVWYGLWVRKEQPRLAEWCLGVGVLLIAGAALMGLFGLGRLGQRNPESDSAFGVTPSPKVEQLGGYDIAPAFIATSTRVSAYHFATPEPPLTLPDYPVPSPTFVPTPVSSAEPQPDSSAVTRLIIGKLSLDAVVKYVPYEEETWLIAGLREEVAWLGNTSWPGLGGNTALAAHVTVRGLGDGPFRHLDQLTAGDEIVLFTEQAIYTYRVREQLVVNADELWVTQPTENSQLTLITCTDWDRELEAYLKRLIVFADLQSVEPMVRRGSR